jgi:hypothetical protein
VTAPPGSLIRLYYDARERVERGDFIRTPTGRTYLIEAVRVQQRGKNKGRQHIVAMVMEPDFDLSDDDIVHPLHWHKR